MTAIATAPAEREVTVASRLFGPLRLDSEHVITFPDGLLGFAGERRFVLLPAARDGVYWLQSVDDGTLVFLLVDPFPVFAGYAVDLPDGAGAEGEPPLVLAIVTLPRTPAEAPTANLQGPLAIDVARRRGDQVILADTAYHTKHPFDLQARLAG